MKHILLARNKPTSRCYHYSCSRIKTIILSSVHNSPYNFEPQKNSDCHVLLVMFYFLICSLIVNVSRVFKYSHSSSRTWPQLVFLALGGLLHVAFCEESQAADGGQTVQYKCAYMGRHCAVCWRSVTSWLKWFYIIRIRREKLTMLQI